MSTVSGRLVRLAAPLAGELALAVLLGVLTVGSSVGLMATSAYLICQAALHPSVAALSVAIVGVRFFGLARGIFRYLERYVTHQLTFKLLARLRVWLYSAIEPLAPARLLAANYRSGDLLGRLVADVETLQDFYARVVAPPLVAIVVGLGLAGFLASFSGVAALVFLAFYALVGLGLPWLVYRLGRHTGQQLIAARADLSAALVDSLQGMDDLLAFGQAAAQQTRIEELDQRLAALQNRQRRLTAWQGSLGNFLVQLAALCVLIAGLSEIAAGSLNPIYLAVLVLAALAGFEAVLPLPAAFQQMSSSLAAATRLFELTDSQPAVQFPAASGPAPRDYSLSFRQVDFGYDKVAPLVLDSFNLEIASGQSVALVGPSGIGKSTVANLLLHFWEPARGEIRLGGQPITGYSQEQFYALLAVVTQDTHLFNTTIRQNIALARPGATQAEIEQAARQAQLHDFISELSQGYDTLVGEQGLRLSGGERQRVAIARALLKDAPILVLDEPTANLDPETERELISTLRSLQQGRTTLLISHRPACLELAERVVTFR